MNVAPLFVSLVLALSVTTANATSIRQENGTFLGGPLTAGWTKKYVTVNKEAASALFDLLSKISTSKQDGEPGLWNYSVKFQEISCLRVETLIQATDPDEYQVDTSCTIEVPYGISANLYRTSSEPKQFVVQLSSPGLLKAVQTNPDTKVSDSKYEYANGAISCEHSNKILCSLRESVK